MDIKICFNPLITFLLINNFVFASDLELLPEKVLKGVQPEQNSKQVAYDNDNNAFLLKINNLRQKKISNAQPKRSFSKLSIKDNDNSYYRYALEIPKNYQTSKKYPLVVFLHGGLSNRPWKNTDTWWNRYLETDTQEFIALYPSATLSNPWWSDYQTEKLRNIINGIKRDYAVDQNKVFLVGISDGGAGAIYQGVLLKDILAGTVSVIGSPSVLAATENSVSKNIYEPNLASIPLLMINSENDPLYPASKIELIVEYLRSFAPQVQFISVKGRHDLKVVRDSNRLIHQFIKENSRTLYPDSLTWQLESTAQVQRNTWVLANSPKPLHSNQTLSNGLRNSNAPTALLRINKVDNTIHVDMSQPLSLTFLISPEHFDFKHPIKVSINGTQIFNEKVETSLNVLNKWIEIDKNAERVFGAEINFTQSFVASSVDFP